MPGINQLGGALTATAAPTPATGAEGNQSSNPQADAGLQVAANDAVKGAAEVKKPESEGTDERTDRARQERRKFAELARSKNARIDERTGDVIDVQAKEDEEAAREAAGENERSPQAKERLQNALKDLFAPRPRPQAQANAKEEE